MRQANAAQNNAAEAARKRVADLNKRLAQKQKPSPAKKPQSGSDSGSDRSRSRSPRQKERRRRRERERSPSRDDAERRRSGCVLLGVAG